MSASPFGTLVWSKRMLESSDPFSPVEFTDPMGDEGTTPIDFRNNGNGRPFVSNDIPETPAPVNPNRGGVSPAAMSGGFGILLLVFVVLMVVKG